MAATSKKESKPLFIPVTITMEGGSTYVFKVPVPDGEFGIMADAIRSMNRGMGTNVDDRGITTMTVTACASSSARFRGKNRKPCFNETDCKWGKCPFVHTEDWIRPPVKPCFHGDECPMIKNCKYGHPSDPPLPGASDPAASK